jgi:hypothetical protein
MGLGLMARHLPSDCQYNLSSFFFPATYQTLFLAYYTSMLGMRSSFFFFLEKKAAITCLPALDALI